MTRLNDWRDRLTVWLSQQHGRTDCALAFAEAVQAMTGVDHAADFRGRYDDHAAGIRLLRKRGYKDHVDFVAQHFSEVAIADAKPGDLVVVEVGGELPALGLVQGPSGCYVLHGGRIGLVPLTAATRAFEV